MAPKRLLAKTMAKVPHVAVWAQVEVRLITITLVDDGVVMAVAMATHHYLIMNLFFQMHQSQKLPEIPLGIHHGLQVLEFLICAWPLMERDLRQYRQAMILMMERMMSAHHS